MSVRAARLSPLWLWIPAIVLMAGLRLLDLSSDPYRGLDWDTGLMTDEGFYTHNARNVALFGHARTDEFNNMLVSPLVHYLQTEVFLAFGFSAVNARLISVALSLLTLTVYFLALRRAFGFRIATTAAIFLGLDHTNVLFNRMALLDTPATLLAVTALYTFIRASGPQLSRRSVWLFGCGALLALAVITRSLCIYLIPAYIAALALQCRSGQLRRDAVRSLAAFAVGLTAVLVTYAAVWYLPHRVEIDALNRYYRTVQLQPDSAARLFRNIHIAFLGDRYGIFSYLFRHTPVVFVLALISIAAALSVNRSRVAQASTPDHPLSPESTHPLTLLLISWLLSAWMLFAISSYVPDRYFVSTYPALFALAALALWRLPELLATLLGPSRRAGLVLGLLVWIVVYHALEAAIHRSAAWALYTGPIIAALSILAMRRWITKRLPLPAPALALPLILWAGVNAGWLADWWTKREHTLAETSHWLARNLPPESVLFGDVAPGLGMDSPFVTVNVMKDFANDRDPLSTYPGRPKFVLTIDGGWKTPYWQQRYTRVVDPSRRIRHWRVLRWNIGLYPAASQRETTSKTSASALEASGTGRRRGAPVPVSR